MLGIRWIVWCYAVLDTRIMVLCLMLDDLTFSLCHCVLVCSKHANVHFVDSYHMLLTASLYLVSHSKVCLLCIHY